MAKKSENGKTNVYIVDDHQVVRKGLSQYINESDEFIVVGGAGDADTAMREVNILKPDIIIVDISLGGVSGFELAKALKDRHDNIYILMHSMHQEIAYIERSIKAGADGYIIKNEPIENVLKAMNMVMSGERYFHDNVKEKLLSKLIDDSSDKEKDPVTLLTNREFEVFEKIGEGFSMDEIADELKISIKTVQTYRERIKEKLHIKKSKDLVHFAFQWVSVNLNE